MLAIVLSSFVGSVLAPRAWHEVAIEPIQIVTTQGTVELPLRGGAGAVPAAGQLAAGGPQGLWLRELAAAEMPDFSLGADAVGCWTRSIVDRQTGASQVVTAAARNLPAAPDLSLVRVDLPINRLEAPPEPRPLEFLAPTEPLSRELAAIGIDPQAWPSPSALIAQLRSFEEVDGMREWVLRTQDALDRLAGLPVTGGRQVTEILAELGELADIAGNMADISGDAVHRRNVRGVRFALLRRLEVWTSLHSVVAGINLPLHDEQLADVPYDECLVHVGDMLHAAPNAEAWRSYLLLETLARIGDDTTQVDSNQRRDLAVQWLGRLDHHVLTDTQRRFLNQPRIAVLASHLRRWATERIDYAELLEQVELVELGSDPNAASSLGRTIRALKVSADNGVADLGHRLEMHYRNANVRLVVSDDLIDRMLPQEVTRSERINDMVAGTRVIGRGRATTRLRVDLLPDAARWQLALEANGELVSNTWSKVGPAKFYNHSHSRFELHEVLTVDGHGYAIRRTGSDANSSPQLSGLETDLDFVPLVGGWMQTIAQRRYEQRLPQTRRAMQRQVANNAASRLEREMRSRADEARDRLRDQVLVPLRQLELSPAAIEMRTAPHQLVGRYRLSGSEQLAARTPRPREPSGSILALQVHESALNNGLDKLELAGKRRDLPTLFRELATAVGREDAVIPEDLRDEKAVIQFAQEQPIHVQFSDQKMHITLRLDQLHAEGRRPWRHLVVRATYQPVEHEQYPRIERDGYIQLRGARLRLRDQIALRGIFSKMFPRHPEVNGVVEGWLSEPQVADLEIAQFVLRDGWVGLAWNGPEKVAARDAAEHGRTTR